MAVGGFWNQIAWIQNVFFVTHYLCNVGKNLSPPFKMEIIIIIIIIPPTYYGPNYIPQKSYMEVLIPNTSECDLIWKHSFYRDNQVKLGH